MRFIYKIILLSSFLFSALSSNVNVDECKSDLYYANGILIDMDVDRYVHEEQFRENIRDIFLLNQQEYQKLSSIKVSYNASQGFFDDIFESAEQVMNNEWGLKEFSNYFRAYLELNGYQESVDLHRPDLTAQVNAYKQSIKQGHNVIVIAHSQGNYYTNEAYELLDPWMKEYFHMMGVATPANHVAGYSVDDASAPYLKFHNDIINTIVTSLPSNRVDSHHGGFPNYFAHDFYDSYLTNIETRDDIFNFILEKIQAHSSAPSQWETDQEKDKGTKQYRITVKHRFDSSIVTMNEDVYPFAPSKKLYQVNGEYVKASCGGRKILDADIDTWNNKKNNEVYYLDGTVEVIVVQPKVINHAVSFIVTSYEITQDYRPSHFIFDYTYEVYNSYYHDDGSLTHAFFDSGFVTHDERFWNTSASISDYLPPYLAIGNPNHIEEDPSTWHISIEDYFKGNY